MEFKSMLLLRNYIKYIFPAVDSGLSSYKYQASLCPDNVLSKQAIASIEAKGFHAKGGGVYALYPGCNTQSIIRLITSYQTISDYLDNLCDRAGVMDELAFFNLHLSMTDALSPMGGLHDYYKYYKYKNDGGYLNKLVQNCRSEINKLPSYNIVKDRAIQLASYYSILQSYKHLPLNIREKKLLSWARPLAAEYGISPWEFCAGTGSTLGIFSLLSASSSSVFTASEAQKIMDAYFPWICTLHILLDYLIDYNEDLEHEDLNFVRYYKNGKETSERMDFFIDSSFASLNQLKYSYFHETVIYGLLSMYLSDSKAFQKNIVGIAEHIISSRGWTLKAMHNLCKKLRARGSL